MEEDQPGDQDRHHPGDQDRHQPIEPIEPIEPRQSNKRNRERDDDESIIKLPRKFSLEEKLENLPKTHTTEDNVDLKALKKFNLSLIMQWHRINSKSSECDEELVSSLQEYFGRQFRVRNLPRTISVNFQIKQKYITNCTLIVCTTTIISEILNSINKKINIDDLIECIKRISKNVFKDINYILFLYLLEHSEEKNIYLFLCNLWEMNKNCSIKSFILSFLFWFCVRYILEQLYYISRNKPSFSLENLDDVNTIIRLGNTTDYDKWISLFITEKDIYQIYAEIYQDLLTKGITLTDKFRRHMHGIVLIPVKNMFDIYLTEFKPREVKFEIMCIDTHYYWVYKHSSRYYKINDGNNSDLIDRMNTIFVKASTHYHMYEIFGSIGTKWPVYFIRIVQAIIAGSSEDEIINLEHIQPNLAHMIAIKYKLNVDGTIKSISIIDGITDIFTMNSEQSELFLKILKNPDLKILFNTTLVLSQPIKKDVDRDFESENPPIQKKQKILGGFSKKYKKKQSKKKSKKRRRKTIKYNRK